MRACIAAGVHPNLVTVLGKLDSSFSNSADQNLGSTAGLVFSFIPPDYTNLGGPPSLTTCTRDTYNTDTVFTLPFILQMTRGIASAVAHLHANGIMHGDLYAHNILANETGESCLGDFGAASFYNPANSAMGQALERLEVRAFGCLLEDLLDRCPQANEDNQANGIILARLRRMQQDCMEPVTSIRPLFKIICETLANI